jgi:ribosome biogenesis GTPase
VPNSSERLVDALVVASFGRQCIVEDPDGKRLRCRMLRKAGQPVCGDRVTLSRHRQGNTIESIAERRNFFPRADRRGRKQVVAANLDRIVIVVAPNPAPTRDLINRYLVACESVGISALICLNKRDLLDDMSDREWSERLAGYGELGYPNVTACCKNSGGLTDLSDVLRNGISILVGQSGVGKSSLVNALIPDLDLKTQSLSDSTGKGRHTTTASTLYHLDGGGSLIDSPGVWEYGIWAMDQTEVAHGFREFQGPAGECRFANCTHVHEPDCGVALAAARGDISADRLDSYRRILASMPAG